MCESRFSTVLKPHRHNPVWQDVTAIRKGHSSIPTAHNQHDELSSFLFFSSWLHELPSWCVPSHYWWASMLMCRQGSAEKECAPVCPTCCLFDCQRIFLVVFHPVSFFLYHLEQQSIIGQYTLLKITRFSWWKKGNASLPFLLLSSRIRSDGGKNQTEMKWRVKLFKLNYPKFRSCHKSLWNKVHRIHDCSEDQKHQDGGLLTFSTLQSL